MKQSLLITGASGFVGSHLVEAALAAGYDVWAGVRPSSSRQWLQDGRIHFITLSLGDADSLKKEIRHFADSHDGQGWDYVVHAAGATKAANEEAFMQTNCEGTRNLAQSLADLHLEPQRFVLMSSLSAVPMKDGLPCGTVAPTAYGRSKYQAEQSLLAILPASVILRPTGVYGPRERDYFLMAKSIRRHVDFAVGFKPQQITFIYVSDLCQATLQALTAGVPGHIYQLSDGLTYNSRQFSLLLQQEMGVRRVLRITAPLWLLKAVCYAGQWISALTHKSTPLNKDKYNILKQRDWQCSIALAAKELAFRPVYQLPRGVAETVAWYKLNKWI